MDKRKAIAGTVLIFLAAATAWFFGFFGGADPALAELDQLRAQMSEGVLSDAQRDALRSDFRQRIELLSEDQRRAFFRGRRDEWRQRAEQRMDEFFRLPPADQNKRLDDMINRMTQPRSPRPQRAGAEGQRRGGDRGNRAGMTEAQRSERAKRRLDRTSPKMRAQFTEFRRRMTQRLEQRGINPESVRGFRGGRRWG